MSQPRRRRRRRRRSSRPSESQAKQQQKGQAQQPRERAEGTSRRRRRGRTRGKRKPTSPQSSEDLVRAIPKPPPAKLTADPDGTTLEQVIGDLQSQWGVPQHPQEYRLLLKVPDAREGAGTAVATEEAIDPPDDSEADLDAKPRREKAPAAPRIGGSESSDGQPRSRRRRGRRRKRRPKG